MEAQHTNMYNLSSLNLLIKCVFVRTALVLLIFIINSGYVSLPVDLTQMFWVFHNKSSNVVSSPFKKWSDGVLTIISWPFCAKNVIIYWIYHYTTEIYLISPCPEIILYLSREMFLYKAVCSVTVCFSWNVNQAIDHVWLIYHSRQWRGRLN